MSKHKPTGSSGPGMPPAQTLRMIWMAMFAATLFYAVIGFVIAGKDNTTAPSALTQWILPALALASGLIAFFTPRVLGGTPPSSSESTSSSLLTRHIVIWAVDESIAIFGLVAVFLGAARESIVFYVLGSWVLLWFHRPRG